jgi:hypothetical protein
VAKITVTVETGAGPTVTSKEYTFTNTEAARIIAAFRVSSPGATQQQLTLWLAGLLKSKIINMVVSNETTTPAAPVLT